MPIYEFHCKCCGKDFEALLRWNAAKEAGCPHCGSKSVAKKLSVFATTSEQHAPVDVPMCTGNPQNCGKCGCAGQDMHGD